MFFQQGNWPGSSGDNAQDGGPINNFWNSALQNQNSNQNQPANQPQQSIQDFLYGGGRGPGVESNNAYTFSNRQQSNNDPFKSPTKSKPHSQQQILKQKQRKKEQQLLGKTGNSSAMAGGFANNIAGFSSGGYNSFGGLSQMQGWQQNNNIAGLNQGMNMLNLNGEGYDGDQYLGSSGKKKLISLKPLRDNVDTHQIDYSQPQKMIVQQQKTVWKEPERIIIKASNQQYDEDDDPFSFNKQHTNELKISYNQNRQAPPVSTNNQDEDDHQIEDVKKFQKKKSAKKIVLKKQQIINSQADEQRAKSGYDQNIYSGDNQDDDDDDDDEYRQQLIQKNKAKLNKNAQLQIQEIKSKQARQQNQQSDDDTDDDDDDDENRYPREGMKQAAKQEIKNIGKRGNKGKDQDSDQQESGQIGIIKPKTIITQNQSSLFIKKLNYDITSQNQMMELLMQPVPKQAGVVLCTIRRDKKGFNRWHPKYELMLSGSFRFLMNGKKRPHNRTSNYLITTQTKKLKKKQNGTLGKLRSNFLGTQFSIYDEGENPKKKLPVNKIRKQYGVILYETNILGSRGPRKMKVLIPAIDSQGRRANWRPMSEKQGILQSYKSGERQLIMTFMNKPPQWKEQLQAYVLNFNGRVEKASVKNFQLIDKSESDSILMQFGRVTKHEFSMDVSYPLSLFQAFSICLSSFDFKFACQ